MFPRILLTIGCVGAAVACGGGSDPSTVTVAEAPSITVTNREPTPTPTEPVTRDLLAQEATGGRVDLRATGNRVIEGPGAIGASAPLTVELPDGRTAAWLVPSSIEGWIAVLDNGSTVELSIDSGRTVRASTAASSGTFDPDDGPPVMVGDALVSGDTGRHLFPDPLPDTRLVTDGRHLVALGGPTERYGHAVLGDAIEASTVEVLADDGSTSTPIVIGAPDVIEAVSPMLADVDEDGSDDVVLTLSNEESGARIAAFSLDGRPIAETDPIGTGNRWRNLLAVAPTGPGGEVEVIDVRTPHIGGILEFFRNDGDGGFELVASASGYSTHSIGSRNLDLGIVTDADGDGRLDVLLSNEERNALAVVTRDEGAEGGAREVVRIALGAALTSNVSALRHRDGGVAYAVGVADGRILVWPGPGRT